MGCGIAFGTYADRGDADVTVKSSLSIPDEAERDAFVAKHHEQWVCCRHLYTFRAERYGNGGQISCRSKLAEHHPEDCPCADMLLFANLVWYDLLHDSELLVDLGGVT